MGPHVGLATAPTHLGASSLRVQCAVHAHTDTLHRGDTHRQRKERAGRAAAASKARKAMVEGGTKELKASRVDEKANSDMTTDGSSYPSLQYCIVFCEFYSLQYYAAVDFASRYAGCSWGYVVWKAVDGVAAIASENQEFRIATGSTSRELLIVRSAVEQRIYGSMEQRSICFDTKNQLFITLLSPAVLCNSAPALHCSLQRVKRAQAIGGPHGGSVSNDS
uniref:Uncharacterized protein n=1 Tax=Oryza meridionalis TaxID=40149 RepID=A0A0E0BWC7_9ORYZ